jgi:hypothetical protein
MKKSFGKQSYEKSEIGSMKIAVGSAEFNYYLRKALSKILTKKK